MYRKRSAVSDVRRFFVALGRLWRARARLRHRPTLRQVRWMAGFDGRDPSSYLLDRSVNYIPAMLPDRMERQLGRHGLRLTGVALDELFDTVVFPDGWGFDLT
jgi:hypothetical protein